MIYTPTTKEVIVRQDGDKVVFALDGRGQSIPWEAAIKIGRALIAQGKAAEEHAKAEVIIHDQAILTRLGIPVGLSNNRAIQEEAAKEAAWNSGLRRYIEPKRASIGSKEVMGTPTVGRG